VISLHGGGSPEAMKMEIWRNYPLGNKVDLVERLLERGVLSDEVRAITRNRQPGRCCVEGCQVPAAPQMAALPDAKAAPGKPRRSSTRGRASAGRAGRRPAARADRIAGARG
jgi:4-hydroxybutyryl-CoA dehydratase/vinylacetyl-CoA-Delta-isomerase